MIYIADTHSLIWFLSEDNKLSIKAKEIFEMSEIGEHTIVIPTIVLAEILYICEGKNRQKEFFETVEKIVRGINYMTYDLDLNVILECKNLSKIPDMHDRIIASTAKLLNAIIITKDKEIIDSNYVKTIW